MDKIQIAWKEQHEKIGKVEVEKVIGRYLNFRIKADASFLIRDFLVPADFEINLDFDWYHKHLFFPGEIISWQARKIKTKNDDKNKDSWGIKVELKSKEILNWNWNWNGFKPKFPPCLNLIKDISIDGDEARAEISIKNEEDRALEKLVIETEVKDRADNFLSGPNKIITNLEPKGRSENFIYHAKLGSTLIIKAKDDENVFLLKEINLSPTEKENKPVAKIIRKVTERLEDKLTHKQINRNNDGYYYVSPEQDLVITLNNISKEFKIQNIKISHPNISFIKADIYEYNVRIHMSPHFTTNVFVTYEVEFEDGKIINKTLPFKIKASIHSLLLMGLLFVIPIYIEMGYEHDFMFLVSSLKTIFIAVPCILAPLFYDYCRTHWF